MTNTLRILGNLSSAFFTASGMWGDLLLIRIFLTCAYAFIIAIQFTRDHNEYEMYVWAIACIYLHGSSAIRLIIDEGPVKLDEKQEQEALWRYFYRRSGITRLLFKANIAPSFELVNVKAGSTLDTNRFFYIILEGSVDIESTVSESTREYALVSGAAFDIKHLHPLLQGRRAYMKESQRLSPFVNQDIIATVSIDTKFFRCTAENMHILCTKPGTKDVAQGLLIATLSEIAERQYMNHPPLPNDSVSKDMIDEENQLISTSMKSFKADQSALFKPLEEWEEPPCCLAGSGSFKGFHRHILHTLKVMFLLPWPLMKWVPGLRQVESLPVPKADPDDESDKNSVKSDCFVEQAKE